MNSPERRGPLLAAGVVAAVLGVVALAALGSRAVHVPDNKVADAGQVASRFAFASGVCAILGATIVAALFLLGRRNPATAATLGMTSPLNARAFVRRTVPWTIAAVALAGVLGAATAPLHDKSATASVPHAPTSAQPGDPARDAGGDRLPSGARLYNGAIVRDAFGRDHVAVDLDGNGQLDTTLEPCPTGTPQTNERPPAATDGTTLVPIDENCDGTIDGYVRLHSLEPVDAGDAPLSSLGSGANTKPPKATTQSGSDRVTAGSANWGRLIGVAAIGLAVLALAGFALHTLLRPSPLDEISAPATVGDDASASVQASLAILRAGDDPRANIIAAYSRLLDGLANAGLPRLAHEGPDEYLRRCCASLRVRAEPLARLTELFTVARFSTHELREPHQQAATEALEAVATDLAVERAGRDLERVGAWHMGYPAEPPVA